jgi:small-conductance mechanosensitive channel
MARIGIERLRTATPTHVAGGFVRLLVLLLAAQQAFIAMGLLTWGEHVGTFLSFIFSNVLLSALIVIAGFAVGTYVRELIINRQLTDPESTRWMAALARAAILVFAFTMAIEHLGIAERFVTLAFAFVFGALCLALALALGLGGQKLAQDLLQRRFGGISKLPEVPKLAAPKAEAHSQSMAPDRKPR